MASLSGSIVLGARRIFRIFAALACRALRMRCWADRMGLLRLRSAVFYAAIELAVHCARSVHRTICFGSALARVNATSGKNGTKAPAPVAVPSSQSSSPQKFAHIRCLHYPVAPSADHVSSSGRRVDQQPLRITDATVDRSRHHLNNRLLHRRPKIRQRTAPTRPEPPPKPPSETRPPRRAAARPRAGDSTTRLTKSTAVQLPASTALSARRRSRFAL